ncbi:MAG: hypothetical protein NXI04_07840 [Planctomycetaceae bacterium]|nr:hypothetical protein [Planctomycetaceae bacterium]
MLRRLIHWHKTSKRRSQSLRPAEVAQLEAGVQGQLESRVLLAAGGLLPPIVDTDSAASAAANNGLEAGDDASVDAPTAATIDDTTAAPFAPNVAPATIDTFDATGFVAGAAGSHDGVTVASTSQSFPNESRRDKPHVLPPTAVMEDDSGTASDDQSDHALFWAAPLQVDLLLNDQTKSPVSVRTTTAPRESSRPPARDAADPASPQPPADRQHVSAAPTHVAPSERPVRALGNSIADSRGRSFEHSASRRLLLPSISSAHWRPLLSMLHDAGLPILQADTDAPPIAAAVSEILPDPQASRMPHRSTHPEGVLGWLSATVPQAWSSPHIHFTDEDSDEQANAHDWAESRRSSQRDDSTPQRRHLWAGRESHLTQSREQRLPSDSPPEPPETDSAIHWFQVLCHPRGPPDSESHSSTNQSLCGRSSVLQRLRHRIAPRGPSLARLTYCDRAIQIPHEAECSR